MNTDNLEYVGFWPRVGASCIDILVQLAITAPVTYAIYGRLTSPAGHFMGPADLIQLHTAGRRGDRFVDAVWRHAR